MLSHASNLILLMSPSFQPCFQLVSYRPCRFFISHLAHVAFPTLLSEGELPVSIPILQSDLFHLPFFPVLRSVGELPPGPVPQSVLAHVPFFPSCFQRVSWPCLVLRYHLAHMAFFPALLSSSEVPSVPVPPIPSSSPRLLSHPVFRR